MDSGALGEAFVLTPEAIGWLFGAISSIHTVVSSIARISNLK